MKLDLLLRDVEVDGRRVDVAVADGRIVPAVGRHDGSRAEVLDGRGGALLPGLHDHHVHLLATAAAATSVDLGDLGAGDGDELARRLRAADRALAPGDWMRVVGSHASIAGDLDRHRLDDLVPTRPARVQDRTGVRWTLNSAALTALGAEAADHPGIERDDAGRPTGRLHRGDDWLRDRLPAGGPVDLAPIGRRLAAAGVTGVTDCTAWTDPGGFALLAQAVRSGALPQRVTVTGAVALAGAPVPPPLERGPVKVLLDDAGYPGLDELVATIGAAHAADRPVAIHTVTRTSLALAVAALDGAPRRRGDRLEHGSVIPPDLFEPIRDLELTVVTQPGFVLERGDRYLDDVDPDDRDHLYRCGSLLDHGIRVAAGSDSPYSDLDPWPAIRTATTRRTRGGRVLGPAEAVDAATALGLWLGPADDPGGPARQVAAGAPADLVLLDRPLAELLEDPGAEAVVATVAGGRVVHHR